MRFTICGRLQLVVLGIGILCLVTGDVYGGEPEFCELWPQGAPGALGNADADRPGVWVYPADRPNGAAILICPGGGYFLHAVDHEGVQPARYFNRLGMTAYVLRYRLNPYRHPVPLQDVQRALRLIRSRSEDKNRIGVMGFSAGGHLAATAMTQFDDGNAASSDPVDRQSCRPDFGILGYPVVSLAAEYSHRGSAKNLLGDNPSDDQLLQLSADRNVGAGTPPVFLFHTAEDTGVSARHSLDFFVACRNAGVAAELHVYQQGPHGVGLADGHPALGNWIEVCGTWLRQSGLLSKGERRSISGTVQVNGKPLQFGTVSLVPRDSAAPVGWAMVNKGKFTIPALSGPYDGLHDAHVVNWGAVAPAPTLDDAVEVKQTVEINITETLKNIEIDLSTSASGQ